MKEILSYINDYFIYNRIDGCFYWKDIPPKNTKAAIGEVAGSIHKKSGYRIHDIYGKKYKSQMLVWLIFKGLVPNNFILDHINKNRSDNRIDNLRLATYSQNQMNKDGHRNNSKKYKGVYFHKKSNKWQASVMLNKKLFHIGLFSLEEDAARAYNEKAKELFGEYAQLNII